MSGQTAYQNAMRRRAELRRELEEIEIFLRLYARYAGSSDEPVETEATSATAEPALPSPKQATSATASLPHSVIRSVILERARPLKRGALARALADAGHHVRGKNPSNYVGTVMWRAKTEFVNLEGHGYWPRDVAYAPAGYEPGHEPVSGKQGDPEEGDLWSESRSAA